MAEQKINLISPGTGINGTYTTDIDATYNIASGDAVFYVAYSDRPFSLQSIVRNLTGILNGTLNIYAGNTPVFSEAILIQTSGLTTASINHLFEKDLWKSSYVFIELKAAGITGGTIKNILTIK